MLFYTARTIAKKIQHLLGRLKTYLKLVKSFRRYAIQILDLEVKIENLEKIQLSREMRVVDVVEGDHFVVKSGGNYYIVRPSHFNPKERCECSDCHFRGSECKHQIAVKRFLYRSAYLDGLV